jgi:hypothetical protein
MKKQLTILVLLLAGTMLTAQDLGKIIIRNASASNPKFIASLNGIRLSNDYVSLAEFNFLDEYNYRVKILQAGSTNMLTFNLKSEPKYISKYVINKDNFGNYAVILESKSLIMDGEQVVTNTPTVAVNPTTIAVNPTTVVVTQTVVNTPTTAVTQQSTAVVVSPMNSAEFNDRLNAIKKTSFDKDRLAKSKQVFEDEVLSTNQVIEVVKVFSFDDSKLDFAKWAYKYTIDKRNYFKLDDHFSFARSKSELREYIKKQPKE